MGKQKMMSGMKNSSGYGAWSSKTRFLIINQRPFNEKAMLHLRHVNPLTPIPTTSFIHPGCAVTRTAAHPINTLTNFSSPVAQGKLIMAETKDPCISGERRETWAETARRRGRNGGRVTIGVVGVGRK